MSVALGAALISSQNPPAWPVQIERIRLARFEHIRIQTPAGFGTAPSDIEALLAGAPSVRSVTLRGEDKVPTPAQTRTDLIDRGWLDVIRRHPEIAWQIEIGNEPDVDPSSAPSMAWYRDESIRTVQQLRGELPDTVTWLLSMPVHLGNVQTVLAGGKVAAAYDGLCVHLYGHFNVIEGNENELSRIYRHVLDATNMDLWVSESGINDPATPQAVKVQRYLQFLNDAPARVRTLDLWAPVSEDPTRWHNYRLGTDALTLLGARQGDTPMALTISTLLISPGTFTAPQVEAAIKGQTPRTPYTEFHVQEIVTRTMHWCNVFGFNHDLVLAQMVHETNYFRYGGDVEPWQWNFAGLGATGGIPGHNFPDIEAGVLAVVAHHAVYRWGARERWPEQLRQYAGNHIDPRYSAVLSTGNAGRMIVLGDYRGTWAVPGTTYPESLVTRARQIAAFAGGGTVALTDLIRDRIAAHGVEVHDIRGQMVRHATLRYRRLSNSAWRNTGVHHTAANRPPGSLAQERQSWINHSAFHVNTRGWPGIAYAIGVSMSGRVFILRDIEEEGYHAFSANASTLAVCGDMTTSQTPTLAELDALEFPEDEARPSALFPALDPYELTPADFAPATPGMLRSLEVVLHVLHNETPELPNLSYTRTYGHQELAFIDGQNAGTQCPGSLLPFVRTYRANGSTIEDGDDDMPPARPETIIQGGNPNGDVAITGGFADTFWAEGWLKNRDDPVAGALPLFGWAETPEGWVKDKDGNDLYVEQRFQRRWLRWYPNVDPPWDIVGVLVTDIVTELAPDDDDPPVIVGLDPEQVEARMDEIVELARKPFEPAAQGVDGIDA